MTVAPPLDVKSIGPGLICFIDADAAYPNSSHTWLAETDGCDYVINPGWTGDVQRVPEDYRERFLRAVKLGTHFHHDSIRQFGPLRENIWISERQAEAVNCNDEGVGCRAALHRGLSSPSTWLTLKSIEPFPVARIFPNSDPVMGDRSGALVALPCSGHSVTDQAYLHRPSRTLWTGDIFYIGALFYFTHGGSLDRAMSTLLSFIERDDWDFAAQPHWDFQKNPDPQGLDFLVPRQRVEQLYADLVEIVAGRVEGKLSSISWWSVHAFVYPVSVGSVGLRNPGHVAG